MIRPVIRILSAALILPLAAAAAEDGATGELPVYVAAPAGLQWNGSSAFSADLLPPGRMEFVSLRPVLFDHDGDVLDERGSSLLEDAALFIRHNPRITRVLVKGHADFIAGGAYNESLSRRRAEAVRARLQELGVPAQLLHLTAHGKSAPVDEDWTPEGRSRNRRVELYVVLN